MIKKVCFSLLFLSFFLYSFSACKKEYNSGYVANPNGEVTDTGGNSFDAPLDAPSVEKAKISVVTNRNNAIYYTGETIQFEVTVTSDGEPVDGQIKYTLSNDGVKVLKEGVVTLKDGTAKVMWKQPSPMIVRCRVSYALLNDKNASGMAAAAVSPDQIKPTATVPDDFMNYWMAQKETLDAIPINADLTPYKVHISGVEVYDITLDNVNGYKVHAYFGKPSGKGPYPALINIPGAGVGSASYNYATNWAKEGFLVMSLSIHDLPNGMSADYYKEKTRGPLNHYSTKGRDNRDTYYFHHVILGIIRAIDYVTSRPEWDKKNLIVNGSSQGGGLTLITTGLDSRVSAAVANVPALCDHSGRNFDRPSGWPQLVPMDSNGKLNARILKVSQYYDAINFARRIRVPMVFGVGLIDNTCHPTTVFSAYNSLKSTNKEIDIAPLMGHAFSPSFKTMRDNFIKEQGKN